MSKSNNITKITLLILFVLVSCEEILLPTKLVGNNDDSLDNLPNDLVYIVGGDVVGKGINSSTTNRNFISCVPPIVKMLPKFLSKYKVAFGGTIASSCGACTALRFNCEVGENITITSQFFHANYSPLASPGSFSEPSDFEAHGTSPGNSIPSSFTCPVGGFITVSNSYSSASYIKVTATSGSNSDTEYLECQ